jgi:acid-sensing ion channel, other
MKSVVLKSGLCYTFNGFDVYRKNSKNHAVQEWTIDEGYAPTASMDAYPYRASGVGVKSGLSVTLKYKKTTLEHLCDTRSGFWVEYRMPYEVPRLTTGYITVSMGNSMTIIVDPRLMTTAEELGAYTVSERNCYFSDERRLKYFEKYTQPNCETECEIDNVLKHCLCFPIFIEGKIFSTFL